MDDVNQSTAGVEPEPESEPNLELEPEAVPTDDDAPALRPKEVRARTSRRRLQVVNAAARRLATARYATDPLEIRRTVDRLARLQPRVRGVTIRRGSVAGVPGEWVMTKGRARPGTVLYLHGGGYIAGGPHTHRMLVGALVVRTGFRAFVPDYRLAPEHRHPAALDDARVVYDQLATQTHNTGRSFAVAGDSAGGGLATALVVDRRDADVRLPDRLALISPWVDLSGPSPETIEERAGLDVVMRAEQIQLSGLAYAEDRIADPSASPLWADLRGLPPTLIQVGTSELIGVEGELLAQRMAIAGVPVALEVWEKMPHVFQAVPVLKERRFALDRLAAFISEDRD